MGIVYNSGGEFADTRFLIVDDFQGMRTMLREMVKDFGAKEVDLAVHGREAIGYLEQKSYDVIICDYNLGNGKNGQQIMEEARHRDLIGSATVWVMISAEKTMEMVIGAAEYQPDDYLIKPITAATLERRLEKLIARKAALGPIDKAVRAKDYVRAIALCDAQLKRKAGNATDLLRTKSELFVTLGEYDQARQVFAQVLALREVPWAQTGLAKVLYLIKDYEGARALLERVVTENNTYLEGYDWLSKVLEQLGQIEEAHRVVTRAAELSPNSMVRQKALGELALQQGDLECAEKAFRKTITLGKHSHLKTASAHFGLAKVLSGKDGPEEAVKILHQARKEFADPEVALQAKIAEGVVFRAAGDTAKAQEAAQEVAQALKESSGTALPTQSALEAAQLMLAAGNKEDANELLRGVAGNNHENEKLLGEIKEVFAAAGMAEDGQKLVEASRREAMETMNKGVRLAADGKLDEALDWLRHASSMLPNNARILLNLAYVICKYMGQHGRDEGMLEEARGYLERALRLSPGEARNAQIQVMVETIAREPA